MSSCHHELVGEPHQPNQRWGGVPLHLLTLNGKWEWTGSDLASTEFHSRPHPHTDLLRECLHLACLLVSGPNMQRPSDQSGVSRVATADEDDSYSITGPTGPCDTSLCALKTLYASGMSHRGVWQSAGQLWPTSPQGHSCWAALPAPRTGVGALAGQRGPFCLMWAL